VLLVFGGLFAALTCNVFWPLRWPAPAAFGSFFAGWLAGELAPWLLALGLAAAGALVALGALAAWPGLVGLALSLAAAAGLMAAQRLASQAGPALDAALVAALGQAPPPLPGPP
jgi:hypothetical protein